MTQLRTIACEQERPRGQPAAAEADERIVFYEGDRIYLRPIEPADEQKLRKWINDPEIWQYLTHRPPVNAVREREFIEGVGRNLADYCFGLVVRTGDRLIGSAGLHQIQPVNRSAVLGIMIGDKQYHGKGFGTEAVRLIVRYGFDELNLNRLALHVFAHNYRAIGCYQKAGFIHEGCQRQALYRGGRYVDEYVFAILRKDWESGRGRRE